MFVVFVKHFRGCRCSRQSFFSRFSLSGFGRRGHFSRSVLDFRNSTCGDQHERFSYKAYFFISCNFLFQPDDLSEYQLWVLSGKEDGAYPLIGERLE